MAARQQVFGRHAQSRSPIHIHKRKFAARIRTTERDEWKTLLLKKRDAWIVVLDGRYNETVNPAAIDQLAVRGEITAIVRMRKGENMIAGARGSLHHAAQKLIENRIRLTGWQRRPRVTQHAAALRPQIARQRIWLITQRANGAPDARSSFLRDFRISVYDLGYGLKTDLGFGGDLFEGYAFQHGI